MRLWTLPFRFLGILALAALASGAWLYRGELQTLLRPQVERARQALGAGKGGGTPAPAALDRARDKVDSMQGWATDSVLLTGEELASLLLDGLPRSSRSQIDSVRLTLGDDRISVAARLSTALLSAADLGPLAGALAPWESVTAEGTVRVTQPGRAEWRVDALTLRGFTLPAAASQQLIDRALPGTHEGRVPVTLPAGVGGLRVRPTGVALYRGKPS